MERYAYPKNRLHPFATGRKRCNTPASPLGEMRIAASSAKLFGGTNGTKTLAVQDRSRAGNSFEPLPCVSQPTLLGGKHITLETHQQLSPTQAFYVRFGTLKAFLCSAVPSMSC